MLPDILIDIQNDELPELFKIYQEYEEDYPHILGFIDMAARWKKEVPQGTDLTIMSPNGAWREDGTFIALMQFSCYKLVMFTLDKNCKNLHEGLCQTKRIDFSREVLFYAIYIEHVSTIHRVIAERKLALFEILDTYLYSIDKLEALQYDITCPVDTYIANLERCKHAETIDSVWPHRYENSHNYIGYLIEKNGGKGIFKKSTNELMAWVLKGPFDYLSQLQTTDGHKRKGYAALVTKALSKEIAKEGYSATAAVLTTNEASMAFFKSLRFRKFGRACFITTKGFVK